MNAPKRILILSLLLASMGLIKCAQQPKKITPSIADFNQFEIEEEVIQYKAMGTPMKGFIARPKNRSSKAPGIIVVHEWWGHNEHAENRARQLAKAGYVAFALDMYGNGKTANHPKMAMKFSGESVKNFKRSQQRFKAAIERLKADPMVDKDNIAAIGFCFGGMIVLNMARTNSYDLKGVISVHGGLDSIIKKSPKKINAKILVLNGAADPLVSTEKIESFRTEMALLNADYTFINYEGAKHAFTNIEATEKGEKFGLPLAYSKEADLDSQVKTFEFLKNLF